MTGSRTRAATYTALATTLLAIGPAVTPASAQDAAQAGAQQQLPEGRALIAKHVEAIGGRDAVLEHQSLHATGTFSIAAMGMSGSFEIYQRKPNEFTSVIEVSGLGQIKRGYNGSVGWSMSPLEGPRVLEGMELAQLQDEADMRTAVRDTSLVREAATIERTEMGGKACYLVQLTWRSGRESFDCYDVNSGLLVATRGTQHTNVGSVESTTIMGEYKQFGSILMAGTSRQQLMNLEQTLTIESVEFNAVDATVFALPAEIQALIGG